MESNEELTLFDNVIAAQLGGVDRADIRQAQRLPDGYRVASAAELTFDPRLAYELALGIDAAHEIFPRYNYTREQAIVLCSKAVFIATIKEYKVYISANGLSFKVKARMQAEDLLTHSYEMATDTETPAAVRADLIKWTAKMGELEPKQAAEGQSGGNFVLNLILGENREAVLTVQQPRTIEEREIKTIEGERLDEKPFSG